MVPCRDDCQDRDHQKGNSNLTVCGYRKVKYTNKDHLLALMGHGNLLLHKSERFFRLIKCFSH